MDENTYARTRRGMHGLAELALAGPQYRSTGRLRLRVLPEGIGTWEEPGVALAGGRLVTARHDVPVDGLTFAEAAARIGVQASPLDDVYRDGPGVDETEVVHLDEEGVRTVEQALATGDRALREFRPDAERVLWPEHFDVAITADDVNYGVSPGDSYLARPYAYVGPHEQRSGEFWNAPFGAARTLEELGDVAAVVAFFEEGARLSARPETGG